jgi:hypothetical protein
MLGKKTIRALCQPSRPAASTAVAAAPAVAPAAANGNEQQQGEAQPQDQAAAAAQGDVQQQQQLPHAAVPAGPVFPALLELDLSCSCSAIGGGIELHLEGMQAAMPLLRVLKLSGLGGFYGEFVEFRCYFDSFCSVIGAFRHVNVSQLRCVGVERRGQLLL